MRWRGREQSQNVEDRRGMSPGMVMGGGGIGVLLIALIAMFLGADPAALQQMLPPPGQQQPVGPGAGGEAGVDDEAREFIAVVLRDTETVWTRLFREQVQGGDYRPPRLVIYSQQDRSACGIADARMGPFYCPADQKVYIDPSFFEELAKKHDAPGDFAQAYVIAHEVAHHVQVLLGFSDQVNRIRQMGNEQATNQASVRLELQADFLAGVWAHYAHQEYEILEPGDVEEAMNAANQIGDDVLQLKAQGYKVPERYTHGTARQRVKWFKAGISSGRLADCEKLFQLPYEQL